MASARGLVVVNLILGSVFAVCFITAWAVSANHLDGGAITVVSQTFINTGTTSPAVSTPIISSAKTGTDLLFPILAIFLINSSVVAVMSGLPILNGVILRYVNKVDRGIKNRAFLETKMPRWVSAGVAAAILMFFSKIALEFGWAYFMTATTVPFIIFEGTAIWIGAAIPIYTLYLWRPMNYGVFLDAFSTAANRKTGLLLFAAFSILAISAVLEVYTIHGIKVF